MSSTDFDDLEDPTFGAAPAPVKRQAPAHSELGGIWNACAKCGGSGQTRWGVCYSCQGKGGKTMKTTFAQRQAARMQREDRADRKRVDNLEAFKAEHPAEWAWIWDRIQWETRQRLDGNDRGDFGHSLDEAIRKFGGLTERQLAAVQAQMAKRAAAAETKRQGTEIDVSGLDRAFAVAREKNAAKAVLRTGTVTFSLAPAGGKNPGAIYAKDDRGEYLGKIAGGKFHKSFACTPGHVDEVIEASRDPKAAALRYAAQTGSCSVCGRELTDPESVKAGIGPICAEKFGW